MHAHHPLATAKGWLAGAWDDPSPPPPSSVRLAALSGYLLLVVLRAPILVLRPRIWAEEGSVYLQAAYDRGWSALFEPHFGYLSLLANLAGLLASLAPLGAAPTVTLIISAVVQCIPAWLILRSRASVLARPWVRMLALVALVLAPSATGEIWLNSINSQHFLGLACCLLLLDPPAHRWRGQGLWILALAGLSSPASIFLLPLFLVRSYALRTPAASVVLGLCLPVQLAAHLADQGNRPPPVDMVSRVAYVIRAFAQLFANPSTGRVILGPLVLVVVTWMVWRARVPVAVVAWLATVTSAGLATWFSLGGVGGQRYAYAPGCCLAIALLAVATARGTRRWVRGVAWAMLLTYFVMGLITYFAMDAYVGPNFPDWQGQALAFQARARENLVAWPIWEGYDPWTVRPPR